MKTSTKKMRMILSRTWPARKIGILHLPLACDSFHVFFSRDVNAYLADWRIFHSILDTIPGLRQYYDNTSDMDTLLKLAKKVCAHSMTLPQ